MLYLKNIKYCFKTPKTNTVNFLKTLFEMLVQKLGY